MRTYDLSDQKSILNTIYGLNVQDTGLPELCSEIVNIIGSTDFLEIHSLFLVKEQKSNEIIRFNGKSDNMSDDIGFLNEISSKLINVRSPLYYEYISDLILDKQDRSGKIDSGSLFSVPVAYNEELIGILHLSSRTGSKFTVEQLSFLLFLAYIIATVLVQHSSFKGLNTDPETLQDRKEKCKFIIDNDFELIMEASTDGKFIYVNDKHEEILGFNATELTGANIFKYIHPEDVAEVIRVFSRGMGTLSSEYVRFRYRNNRGYWLWLESMGNPYINSEGEVRAIVASREIKELPDNGDCN